MVLAHSDIAVRIVDCSPLTYYDISGFNYFATEFLESKALALGFTTVLRT